MWIAALKIVRDEAAPAMQIAAEIEDMGVQAAGRLMRETGGALQQDGTWIWTNPGQKLEAGRAAATVTAIRGVQMDARVEPKCFRQ